MHDFLKKILGRKEPEPTLISFDSIPEWLSTRRKLALSTFESETTVPVQNIRNAAAQLQHIVNSIAGAEHDPKIHPKLKSIAKNSLPLFVRAMNTSLSKELPGDVDGFYPAAVECVKGCLNSTRGQGRYLQVVFPDEMKSVRTGIDAMGREINGLTDSLGRYRKELDREKIVGELYEAVRDLKADYAKSAEKEQRIIGRITEITDRITKIGNETCLLCSDEQMKEISGLRSALAAKERERDAMVRSYAALSMTASHVFRKAEKIAVRQKHPPEVSALRHAMELLSDHAMPEPQELTAILAAACPIAERMITSGEIVLKNKEEHSIFSDTSRFCQEMQMMCRDLRVHEDSCAAARESLTVHPVLTRMNSLERERHQLESRLSKERQSLKELEDWRLKTGEKIPVLVEELRIKIGEIAGENVQLQVNYQGSA
jgi:hypothetical protein